MAKERIYYKLKAKHESIYCVHCNCIYQSGYKHRDFIIMGYLRSMGYIVHGLCNKCYKKVEKKDG